MPSRKLVKIGETPKLPTINEFFTGMAEQQHEEIQKLKQEIAGLPPLEGAKPAKKDPRKPVSDPWLLHPTRIKRTPKKKKAPRKPGSTSVKRASKKMARNPKRKP